MEAGKDVSNHKQPKLGDASLPGITARDAPEFYSNPLAYRQIASTIQHAEAHRLTALYDIRPESFIIDLGCGDGSLAYDHLRTLVPEGLVVGVEKSGAMIRSASRYVAGKPGSDRIHFLEGDITEPDAKWLNYLSRWVTRESRPTVVVSSSAFHSFNS